MCHIVYAQDVDDGTLQLCCYTDNIETAQGSKIESSVC